MAWNFIYFLFSLGDLVATKSFDIGLQVVTRYIKIHKTIFFGGVDFIMTNYFY